MENPGWVEIVLMLVLAASAAIHLIPVVGVLSVGRVESLYATTIEGPDLAVMMRHRALLFGVLGALLIAALFMPALRWPMVLSTLVSDLGFAALMRAHPGTGPALARVLRADVVSIALLVVATACLALD